MSKLEWERYCNWTYEINQPLECFLNDPQPGLTLGQHVIGVLASLIFVWVVGAILEWVQK